MFRPKSLFEKKKKVKESLVNMGGPKTVSVASKSLLHVFFGLPLHFLSCGFQGKEFVVLAPFVFFVAIYNVLLCKFYFIATLVSQHASLGGGAYLDLDILWVIDRLEGSVV